MRGQLALTGRDTESFSLGEYLDAYWALMLNDGRGGMGDFAKYRQALTDMMWLGKQPELTAEEQVESSKAVLGQPVPQSAMDELREMHEKAKLRTEGAKK